MKLFDVVNLDHHRAKKGKLLMGDSLVGKITVTLVFIAPEEAADLLRGFFDDHKGFMVDKSKKEGVLKLVHYYVSEGPEYGKRSPPDFKELDPFFFGEYPEKTGRILFVLNEVYESYAGLEHHYIETGLPAWDVMKTLMKDNDIEFYNFSHIPIRQSLWD